MSNKYFSSVCFWIFISGDKFIDLFNNNVFIIINA